jgi:hypothetical protein
MNTAAGQLSSGCPLEARLPGCPRLLPGRAHRSYATGYTSIHALNCSKPRRCLNYAYTLMTETISCPQFVTLFSADAIAKLVSRHLVFSEFIYLFIKILYTGGQYHIMWFSKGSCISCVIRISGRRQYSCTYRLYY